MSKNTYCILGSLICVIKRLQLLQLYVNPKIHQAQLQCILTQPPELIAPTQDNAYYSTRCTGVRFRRVPEADLPVSKVVVMAQMSLKIAYISRATEALLILVYSILRTHRGLNRFVQLYRLE